MKYLLTKGRYYVGDPANLIVKNEEGSIFIEKLWDLFYQDMNKFHELMIDNIKLYAMRTEGGDGYFDGIGTDTGVFIIIELDQLKGNSVFKEKIIEKSCKIITLKEDTFAEVIDFNLDIKGHLKVETC